MERQFRNSCQLGQIEIVKDLISQGVDVKSKDQLGRDGLFWAAERGQVEIVKLLMSLDKCHCQIPQYGYVPSQKEDRPRPAHKMG